MEYIVLEIPQGRDVVESLINIARSRQAGITVLSGTGLVSDVTFLLKYDIPVGFSVKGPFNMISLKGTYINSNIGSSNSHFSVFFSNRNQGQVLGGIVEGKIKAAGVVLITAVLIRKPDYHRLSNVGGNFHEMEDDKLPLI